MKIDILRPNVYLDVSIGNEQVGRIVIELYSDLAPKACENFLNLCKGYQISNDIIGLKNTVFHKVLKNFVIQGGDVDYKYGQDYPPKSLGSGSVSTINNQLPFEDENLSEAIDTPFKLCMANNSSKNANGSQFFISTYSQSHLTGKHTVFGKVIFGKSVVREIEKVNTNSENVPIDPVIITDCGEWNSEMPVPIYNASYDQIGGDIYEEYPDDDENIDKNSSESVYYASDKIKTSGNLLLKAGDKKSALFKYKKCLRYVMEYFPDPDDEPQWYSKYEALKKSLYLNMSLVCLQLEQYSKSVDYANYLLEMQIATSQDKAKAHFRKGSSLFKLKKYPLALTEFKNAHSLMPNDAAIQKELEKCEEIVENRKKEEKSKYAKFFS